MPARAVTPPSRPSAAWPSSRAACALGFCVALSLGSLVCQTAHAASRTRTVALRCPPRLRPRLSAELRAVGLVPVASSRQGDERGLRAGRLSAVVRALPQLSGVVIELALGGQIPPYTVRRGEHESLGALALRVAEQTHALLAAARSQPVTVALLRPRAAPVAARRRRPEAATAVRRTAPDRVPRAAWWSARGGLAVDMAPGGLGASPSGRLAVSRSWPGRPDLALGLATTIPAADHHTMGAAGESRLSVWTLAAELRWRALLAAPWAGWLRAGAGVANLSARGRAAPGFRSQTASARTAMGWVGVAVSRRLSGPRGLFIRLEVDALALGRGAVLIADGTPAGRWGRPAWRAALCLEVRR